MYGSVLGYCRYFNLANIFTMRLFKVAANWIAPGLK